MSHQKQKKRNGKPIKNSVLLMFSLVVGALLGYLLAEQTGDSLFELIVVLLGLWAGFLLQTVIHEGGHLIFGLLTGYHFSSFRVGSLMWLKENGKIRVKCLSIAGTGGQCLMTPPPLVDGTMPVFWYHMGGPILNLLTGVVFVGLYLALPRIPFLSVLLIMGGLFGIFFALVNGIPIHTKLVENDGCNALSLCSSQAARESFWMQLKINESSAGGVRLKDMPEEWFVVPADEELGNSLTAAQGVFAANRLMDAHRFEEADRLMEHLLTIRSGIAGLHRSLLLCDRIYLELMGECREEKLDYLCDRDVEKFMAQMKKFPSVLRTRYAEALLQEKDSEKAEKIRQAFEQIAKTYPYYSDIASERELMELARERAEHRTE